MSREEAMEELIQVVNFDLVFVVSEKMIMDSSLLMYNLCMIIDRINKT